MGDSKRIAIIGAGMAGLAAAYDLNKAGHLVVVYEAAPGVGGLAAGFKAPHWDWTLERFYHHWFASDKHMLGLIEELGWSDQVLFPRPYTAIYFEGNALSRSTRSPATCRSSCCATIPSLMSPVLAWRGCISAFPPTGSHSKNIQQPRGRAAILGSASTSCSGGPCWWASSAKITPILSTWPGSGRGCTRGRRAWAPSPGGSRRFMDKLADLLRSRGVEIRLGTAVTGIRRRGDLGLSRRPGIEIPV